MKFSWPFSFKKSNESVGLFASALGVRSSTRSPQNSIRINTTGGSGGSKAPGGFSGDGRSVQVNTKKMILNSRKAMLDSLEANSIVNRNADIVTDTGIKIQPTCNASILGMSDEEADRWNEDVYERFDLFMSSKKCHRSRQMNGYDATRLYNKTLIAENDQYVRFYFEDEPDALSTVSFEFIDPLNVWGDGIVSTDGEYYGVEGINYDSKGREVSFDIQKMNKDGTSSAVTIPAMVGSRYFMVHGFIADHITQLRGYSQMGHILQEFQNFTDFTKAHIDKAIQQASIAIAVENTGDADPSDPFMGDVTAAAGPRPSSIFGSSSLTDDEKVALEEEQMSIDRVENFSQGSSGSLAIVNLRAKDKIHSIGNTAPVTNYDKFVDAFTSHMAAAARMPVEILLMKFGQNYSASRAALLLFYRVAEIYRHKIDADFLTPLYENWLSEEIASGRVKAPGFVEPIARAAWCSHGLIAAPVPNIDPSKTADANMKNIQMGLTTYDRASQETNGSNGKANRAANKRQGEDMHTPYWMGAQLAPVESGEDDE